MRRSWFLWINGFLAVCVAALLVVASGPAQEPLLPKQSPLELPKIEVGSPSALVPVGPKGGMTDFAYTEDLSSGEASKSQSFSNPQPSAGGPAGRVDVLRSEAMQAEFVADPSYRPREEVQLADPSNYGERFTHDARGNPLRNEYLVVLHETVGSVHSALNLFKTPHPRDEDQVSYHTLIAADGTVIYVVPPEQRAFGAGDSVFLGNAGEEAVYTNPEFPSSVNNFAYHVSLETPPDGRNNNASTHSGYTEAQYRSLAWLLSRSSVPDDRITTHAAVDRSGSRMDPRSFDTQLFFTLLHQYPNRVALGTRSTTQAIRVP